MTGIDARQASSHADQRVLKPRCHPEFKALGMNDELRLGDATG
jgi:hypothetical protein